MKKYISLFLSVILVFSLIGCNNNVENNNSNNYQAVFKTALDILIYRASELTAETAQDYCRSNIKDATHITKKSGKIQKLF